MNTIEKMLAVMQAYLDGKPIARRDIGCEGYFSYCENPEWNWHQYDYEVMKEEICKADGDFVKEAMDVMKAYGEGHRVEVATSFKNDGCEVATSEKCDNPLWDWEHYTYILGKDLKLVPYETAEEFTDAMEKHGRFLRPYGKSSVCILPCMASDKMIWSAYQSSSYKYEDLVKNGAVWKDGTPCGKYVEES